MKIVGVNSLYAPFATGGAEATLKGLAEALVARGHEVHVICLTPEARPHEAEIEGVTVHYEPSPTVIWPFDRSQPAWRKALFQLLEAYNPIARRRLAHLLAQLRPDVVHVHNFKGFSASIWRAAAAAAPLVQTLHDYTLVCPRSVMFKAGRNCTRQCFDCRVLSTMRRRDAALPSIYTAVSHRMIARMAATQAFAHSTSPVVIRGDNPPTIATPVRRARSDAPITFGFLGRLDRTKGVETLIAATAQSRLHACAVLVAGTGDDDYVAHLHSLAASVPNLKFVGFRPVEAFFEEIDVLVVPSVWEEPLGRVVHEAFAYATPVVASRIGGIPEILTDGVEGLLVAPADVEALASAMRRMADDPAFVSRAAEASRTAAAAFERGRIVDEYEAVLTSAAGRARCAA